MPNRAVAVYEQVKGIGWKKVVIPTRTKSDGKLFLKDDRAADFFLRCTLSGFLTMAAFICIPKCRCRNPDPLLRYSA
jgi:hypothetical protein